MSTARIAIALVVLASVSGCSGGDSPGAANAEVSTTVADSAVVESTAVSTTQATSVDTTEVLDPLPTTGDVRFHLPSGAEGPRQIAAAGPWVFTVNTVSSNLTRIDPATGDRQNVPLPESLVSPTELAFDGASLWVASSDVVVRVDPSTGETELIEGLDDAGDLVLIGGGGGAVWFVDSLSGDVLRVDAATGEIDATPIEADGMLLAEGSVANGVVWLFDFYGGGVVRLDAETGLADTLRWPPEVRGPNGMAVADASAWTWDSSRAATVGLAADGSVRTVPWEDGGSDVVVVGSNNDVFLIDPITVRVLRVDATTSAVSEVVVPDGMLGPIGGTVIDGQLWLIDNVGSALARVAVG